MTPSGLLLLDTSGISFAAHQCHYMHASAIVQFAPWERLMQVAVIPDAMKCLNQNSNASSVGFVVSETTLRRHTPYAFMA